jgi:hypothetical protein
MNGTSVLEMVILSTIQYLVFATIPASHLWKLFLLLSMPFEGLLVRHATVKEKVIQKSNACVKSFSEIF